MDTRYHRIASLRLKSVLGLKIHVVIGGFSLLADSLLRGSSVLVLAVFELLISGASSVMFPAITTSIYAAFHSTERTCFFSIH